VPAETDDRAKRKRRTQAERSAETQDRILSAADECILRLGLQNASIHEIARAAEVSRGAMLHHFPSRADLLRAVFSRLLEREADQIEAFSKDMATDGSMLDPLVRFIWDRYRGPLFLLTLDFLAQARQVAAPAQQKVFAMNQTMFLIRGMALSAHLASRPRVFRRLSGPLDPSTAPTSRPRSVTA